MSHSVEECTLEYNTNLNLLASIITMMAGMRDRVDPGSPLVLNTSQIRGQHLAGQRSHSPPVRFDTNVPHDDELDRRRDMDHARITSVMVVEPEGGNTSSTLQIGLLLTTVAAFPLGQRPRHADFRTDDTLPGRIL